jgi:hypothetical protein
MDKNILNLAGIIIVIAIASAALIYWRADHFGAPEDIAQRGLSTVRREAVLFYGVLPLVFGGIAWFVYKYMVDHSPENADTNYLLLALAIGIGFTVLAAVVYKGRGFSEFVTLHIIYLAGFGWVMPRLLTFS